MNKLWVNLGVLAALLVLAPFASAAGLTIPYALFATIVYLYLELRAMRRLSDSVESLFEERMDDLTEVIQKEVDRRG